MSYLNSTGLPRLVLNLKNRLVPAIRKINGKPLSTDITLSATDIGYSNPVLPNDNTVQKAVDSLNENTVKLSGNQNISGTKKFDSAINIDTMGNVASLRFQIDSINSTMFLTSEPYFHIRKLSTDGENASEYQFSIGSFSPRAGDTLNLGTPSGKWNNIYGATSAINTSSAKQKKNVSPLDKIKDFFMALNPVSFLFKDGTSGRTHHGLIAEEVEAAMTANGLADMDFAGLIKSPDEENEGEYIYGLRYSEFIPMLIKMVQDLQREIDAIKKCSPN